MIELLSNSNKNLDELYNDINIYYSTDELKINTTEEKKYQSVEEVKKYAINKNYKYNDIDGVRVEFEDGWALIRFSNTGPIISARFEASTKERLQAITDEFMTIINKYKI